MKMSLIIILALIVLTLQRSLQKKKAKRVQSAFLISKNRAVYKKKVLPEKFLSFIEKTKKEDEEENLNTTFEDELASEDKYDTTNMHVDEHHDLNDNSSESNVDDLMNQVREDLVGEEVSYHFD